MRGSGRNIAMLGALVAAAAPTAGDTLPAAVQTDSKGNQPKGRSRPQVPNKATRGKRRRQTRRRR